MSTPSALSYPLIDGSICSKVTLVEPDIPVPKHKNEVIVNPAVKLTDKNHVEWTKEIEAYQTEELHLKYVVEFPANVDISIGY